MNDPHPHIQPVPAAPDPVQAAAIEKLAERAAAVSKRLATHWIPVNVQIARHQNGHVSVQFDVHVDFMVALGEMLAEYLEDGIGMLGTGTAVEDVEE